MKAVLSVVVAVSLLSFQLGHPAEAVAADASIPLFDGKSLDGWKAAEYPDSIRVEQGAIVCHGPRAHAYYTGDVENAGFRNFELTAVVKTWPGANSGIYFHTEYEDSGYPKKGYEAQINNTYTGHGKYYEYRKTGSLYGVRNLYKSIARDGEWFTMRVRVVGKRIRVFVDDTLVVDYTEPDEPVRIERRAGRRLGRGTFALQCHDPGSKVAFKEICVEPLADNLQEPAAELPVVDERYAQIMRLQMRGFPLIDLHVHLKGGLTLEEALANSRRVGIHYGIAPNCGVGFPITDDAGIDQFVRSMKQKPCFLGMQAEGREWVDLFSKEAVEQFDYVFTDAMTFTDHRGKRVRLWMKDEVEVGDKQAFMEMLVQRIVSILNDEPIDVYVNPTYLPAVIAGEYDQLWTEERMDRVIEAAGRNGVAVEINAKLRLPRPEFIKRAKRAGVKFTFGTNNGGPKLGRLEYCLDVIEQCGLVPGDMFVPGMRGIED
jgi:hypothetical protein